jgi:hypothetical protein
MEPTPPRLYGTKQIVIIAASLVAGIGFFLFRRYHETGRIGVIEIGAACFTLLMGAAIAFFIVRHANSPK